MATILQTWRTVNNNLLARLLAMVGKAATAGLAKTLQQRWLTWMYIRAVVVAKVTWGMEGPSAHTPQLSRMDSKIVVK